MATLHSIAEQRGDVILEGEAKLISAGLVGQAPHLHLTVRFACGHTSDPLSVKASHYKGYKKGCLTCNLNKLVRGTNDLATMRPDIARQIAAPWDPSAFAVAGRAKVEWVCEDCGHRWTAMLGSRTLLDSGCPECNGAGGYDEALPGTLYVVKGVSHISREVLVKAGISNVVEARLYRHRRQGLRHLLASCTWSDGSVALRVERHWKFVLRAALPEALLATKDDLSDGYREAVRDSEQSMQALVRLLDFAKAQSPDSLTEWQSAISDLQGHSDTRLVRHEA